MNYFDKEKLLEWSDCISWYRDGSGKTPDITLSKKLMTFLKTESGERELVFVWDTYMVGKQEELRGILENRN